MKTKRKRTIWVTQDSYQQKIVQEFVHCFPDTDVIGKSGGDIVFIDEDGGYYLNEQSLIGLISAYHGKNSNTIISILEQLIQLEYVAQLVYSYRPADNELLLAPQFDFNNDHLKESENDVSMEKLFKTYLQIIAQNFPDLKLTGVYIDSVFELGQPNTWTCYEKSDKADVKQGESYGKHII